MFAKPIAARILLLSGSALALLCAAPAWAQSNPAPAPAEPTGATTSRTIETVIVTATKIRTNLQKTPIAVTAISGKSLDQANLAAPRDLDKIVPGMVVNTTPSNPLAITIRGAGYEGIENTSAQPGVSYNQNGVYIASPTSLNANFLDVDTIEVLRGPQGTVLGQNSDGGAINVTTVRPVLGVYNGTADLSYGSYNYERLRVAGNIPIGTDFAVRLALQQQRHDGWGNATEVPGTDGHYQLGNEDSVNARIDALWHPIQPLTIELWAEHFTNDYNGDAFKNLDDPNPDPRELTQDFPSKTHNRADTVALNVGYDLGWSTAKFIGSYQEGSLDASEDLDKLSYATAIPILGVHDIDVLNDRDGHSYTAEVDLTSKPGTSLDWIVGAFYLQQTYNEAVEEYQYNNNAANQAAYEAGEFNFYAPFGEPVNITASNPYIGETENFTGPVAFETRDTQKLYSGSLYGQGTYHITKALRIVLGGRGTIDNQVGDVADYFGLLDRNNGVPYATLKTSFQRLTGKAELEYDITPLNTTYGMVSDGIKPGGANLNPGAVVIPTVFKPETVTAFELGSKNEFFDKTLRLNLSAFYNIIHNFQVDSEDPLPFDGGLTNVAKSHTYGLEGEVTQLLPYDLRVDGNFTVEGSKVDSHTQLFDPAVAEQIDIANGGPYNGNDVADRFAEFYSPAGDVYGKQLPKVPPFTGNIALQHTLYFPDGGKLASAIHFVYRSPYYFRIYNSPLTDKVPPQRQIDLNFTYTARGGHWHGDFLVINLTNSDSVNSRYTDNFGTFITANYYVPPRQFIGRIGYAF
jgi:iron complex outermembrane receptor protein